MTYLKNLTKMLLKNKLNIIPVLIPIIVMVFLLVMNTSASNRTSYVASLRDNIGIMEGALLSQQGYLDEDLSEEDYEGISNANTIASDRINRMKESVSLAQQNRWAESLTIQLSLVDEEEMRDIEQGNFHENMIQMLQMRKATYQELIAHNLEPQTDGLELKGTNFVYRMMDSVVPVIFLICLITILSNVVCGSITNKMDIEDIFPVSQVPFQLKKIALLTGLSVVFYSLFLVASFLIPAAINGTGSLNYPINLFSEKFAATAPLSTVISQAFILQVLSILFLVCCVYLISILTKSSLFTLFISVISILGLVLLTGQIAPMAKILHLLPTTYVNAVGVATNRLAFENLNNSISFINGIIVLSIFSLVLMSLIIFIKARKQRQEILIASFFTWEK